MYGQHNRCDLAGLGFLFPGAISLFSIWSLTHPSQDFTQTLKSLNDSAKQITLWPIGISLLFVSYMTAWRLQAIHNGVVDAVFQLVRPIQQWAQSSPHIRHILAWPWLAPLWFLLWPVIGLFYYMVKVSKGIPPGETPSPTDSFSLVTRGALSPDHEYLNASQAQLPGETSEQFARYPERLSALMLMTGNLAIAGILFLTAWRQHWLAYIAVLLLYLEYWRLLYTRNMQYSLHFRRHNAAPQGTTGSEESQKVV